MTDPKIQQTKSRKAAPKVGTRKVAHSTTSVPKARKASKAVPTKVAAAKSSGVSKVTPSRSRKAASAKASAPKLSRATTRGVATKIAASKATTGTARTGARKVATAKSPSGAVPEPFMTDRALAVSMAKDPKTGVRILTKLSTWDDEAVQMAVANHPKTNVATLKKLWAGPHSKRGADLQFAIAVHRNIDQTLLDQMSLDPDLIPSLADNPRVKLVLR